MTPRFEIHAHTEFSNLRLLDCINKPKNLIQRAIDIGLKGICITDHESLSSHIEVNTFSQQIQEKNPEFKVGLGNEIYLCGSRENGQKYFHFILIAKNKIGHKALKELSSRAWLNSYWDRGMERVVTLYSDVEEILAKYPNSLIATTACLGGELSATTAAMIKAEKIGDEETRAECHGRIVSFLLWAKEIFGEDFYIECAPGASKDQIEVNKRLVSISNAFDLKMVIGSDAHYLKKEDRFVHETYLNSKDGEREVSSFYEYSYLQEEEDVVVNLKASNFEEDFIYEMFQNSMEIYNKIENYSLLHKQTIPKVEVFEYPIHHTDESFHKKYPTLAGLMESEDKVERYWAQECMRKLNEVGKMNETYMNRLEEEADIKKTISEKLETNMFSYPVTLQHYVDLFWKCGSMVGAGRGSSCSGLNHYLLGITQLDPIQWSLPFWRYLNKDRVELGDIDIDLCPSKRPLILKEIKKERGQNFKKDIDDISRENLGCTLIATFGTEGSKSAVLTACRGYRSEDFPDGIDVDTAQFMSSLIPSERGFLWSLSDVVYGNKEKDRKPSQMFIDEVNKYDGLLDIMLAIEGLVNKRSSHASGVIMFDEDPYEFGCFMRTPSGDVITQFDLHTAEAAGMTKYDFLVTAVQDKLTETIKLLQKNNEIEPELSLKEVYDKYFHPNVLPIEDYDEIWEALHEGRVLNVFQFDSDVGSQAAKKIKPRSILELADANGLMRLMTSEKGEETPMDKYIRFKNDISLWYDEMKEYGLTKEEQDIVKPYFLKSHGVPPSQEQLMQMLMDKNICNFTLAEANQARKIVGKKQMSKIPELREKVSSQAKSPCLGNYIWSCGVAPQLGYSFSIIHALAYSFIGYQTLYIATKWNPIYWNTACLIINSESQETESENEEDKRNKTTDYAKTAKALGDIISKGIKVSLIDINKSSYSFEPDKERNEILFALKAISGINDEAIKKIIDGRPYTSFKDFLSRVQLNKTAMIALIKAGAFDRLETSFAEKYNVESRLAIMAYYLSIVSEPKKRLTLQNLNGLINQNLIPESMQMEIDTFKLNKYLKANKTGDYYRFADEGAFKVYLQYFREDVAVYQNGQLLITQKDWDKQYNLVMDKVRDWLKENQEECLKTYNNILLQEEWNKYALGNISSWEMDALCFYYHKHELADIDTRKYGIVDFFGLPAEPEVEKTFKRNGKNIPIFRTYKIIGTVIGKDDTRSTVSILTTKGVVPVKFTKEYYAMFNRQLSEKQDDGTKKVVEKGWFSRGRKIMLTGFRRDDMFVTKTYSHTPTHQLYLISNVFNNGTEMEIVNERIKTKED